MCLMFCCFEFVLCLILFLWVGLFVLCVVLIKVLIVKLN